ncbi:hypothetical protein ACIA98_04675 [Streptomyces sp. NPDC051366]|uniref:hypothetical protein n=1 Tax=Streptomyces sp. NPDC051366 TaxID=3365652 RepID=UPI0037B4A823
MTIHGLLHSGVSAALILASTIAGSYVLLVTIVLISPTSTRGKAARGLLSHHPLSKHGPDSHSSHDIDTSTPGDP